jgi:hypothetical protein
MAGAAPNNAELMTIVTTLQVQVTALQNASPAAAAAPPAGAAPVVFADTPQMLGVDDLIDNSMKRGSAIFKQGCKALNKKALTNGFAMTPDQTIIFVEAFHHRTTVMVWNQGTRQITTFTNSTRCQVNIIKSYSQIDKATLKTACERSCKLGQLDAQTWAKQNNTMIRICQAKSLMEDAQARLLTYRNEYTFDGVEYAPLMYKIIMHLTTINSVATMQTLCNNLQLLRIYAATVNDDIDKLHLPWSQPLATPLESYLRLTFWSPATTSSHTSFGNMRTTSMTSSQPSPTRPSRPQPSTSLIGS